MGFSPNWFYSAAMPLVVPRYLRFVGLWGRDMNTESPEYNESLFLTHLWRCVPLNNTNERVSFVHLRGYLLFLLFKIVEIWNTKEEYNGVNNQRDATTFPFINLFNSALHVSGDKFAHPQEQFFWLYIQLLVQCTDTAANRFHGWDGTSVSVHCTKNCIYRQKVLLKIGEFVARNM